MTDWAFIDDLEGGLRLEGYLPRDPDMHSGVTIAAGVDLGWLPAKVLAELPGLLQAKLSPYIGLRGDAALVALRQTPLELSREEALMLEEAERADFTAEVAGHFGRDACHSFAAIRNQAQTVIMSVAYQYGDPWRDRKCGAFWSIACRQAWPELVAYLRIPEQPDGMPHFPDRRFRTRRRREADFLATSLQECS